MINSENKDQTFDILEQVKRVTKVSKGGRRFSFNSIVVVGDKNGKVGYGKGKASEVTDAKNKARSNALKSMYTFPIYQKRTIHHDVYGKNGASSVMIRRAPAGTGIIAGGGVRTVLSLLGIQDAVAKSNGSTDKANMIEATFDALRKLSSPRNIAKRRGISLSQLSSFINEKKDRSKVNLDK